jgi:hypothetical protein
MNERKINKGNFLKINKKRMGRINMRHIMIKILKMVLEGKEGGEKEHKK